jgi:hypothetical protein
MQINELPSSTLVDRNIPKTKFYEKGDLSKRQKQEFIEKIAKITWKYKLSEQTIGITKTSKVLEIQIFEVELKEKSIPKNSLLIIEKLIPYKILYVFRCNGEFCYGIHFSDSESHYHFLNSDWNKKMDFEFSALNLETLYEKLVRKFIPLPGLEELSYNDSIRRFREIQRLKREIERLEKKIAREKQFNKQVEWNQILRSKKQELTDLT